jgi:hypothetical protein
VATFTVVTLSKLEVKATASLPGGTIRSAGKVTASAARIPVVGGTGKFAGAGGTVEVRDLDPSGSPALNVYRLRLP